MKVMSFLSFLFFSIVGNAQTENGITKFINPASLLNPKGYSHATVVDLGNCKMVIVSGQVALDSANNLVGKGDVAKQTEEIFLNIKSIITASGGTMDNLVKLGIFMLDISQIQAVRDVRNRFINLKKPPASTLVEVSKLFRTDILIEIEATAIIPK